jgi:predicted NBD/HSP70 family sugar kinase
MKAGKVKIWQLGSILRLIYKRPGITRAEISKILDVDKSMVTHLTSYLYEKKFLRMDEPSGKKVPLTLDPNCAFTVGVEIQPEFQAAAVVNAAGEIIRGKEWHTPVSDIGEFFHGPLARFLQGLDQTVSAIGLGIPGVFNSAEGTLLSSQPFSINEKIRLPGFSPDSGCHAFYDNDAKCAGWGLVAFERERENFFLLMTEFEEHETPVQTYKRIAIGSALFFNQKAWVGSHHCAGEFKSFFENRGSKTGQSALPHDKIITMKTDKAVFSEFVNDLAANTGFIVSFLDLGKVYLCGSLESERELVTEIFEKQIRKNKLHESIQKISVEFAGKGPWMVARGAAGMAFERLFIRPVPETPHPFYQSILLDDIDS